MGKDKITYKNLETTKSLFFQELEERSKNDINDILQFGGLQTDLYKECWLSGFRYAYERIEKIGLLLRKEK